MKNVCVVFFLKYLQTFVVVVVVVFVVVFKYNFIFAAILFICYSQVWIWEWTRGSHGAASLRIMAHGDDLKTDALGPPQQNLQEPHPLMHSPVDNNQGHSRSCYLGD
jgi:hypothetical protein